MKFLFQIASFCWILSPIAFITLRLSGVVNVYAQNTTILLVLCFASTVCLFLNAD